MNKRDSVTAPQKTVESLASIHSHAFRAPLPSKNEKKPFVFPHFTPIDFKEAYVLQDLEFFDPHNKDQIEKWGIFYQKISTMDADPDLRKFHLNSSLSANEPFLNALKKGMLFFEALSENSLKSQQMGRASGR